MLISKLHLPVLGRNTFVHRTCCLFLRPATTATNVNDGFPTDLKPFSAIPGPSGLHKIPYVGTALLFKPFTQYDESEVGKMIAAQFKRYGDIIKLRMGRDYWVVLNHPDYAKTVLQANYEQHKRLKLDLPVLIKKRTGRPLGLPSLEGKEWAALRKPAQEKMLRPAVVSNYVPLIEKVTNDFITRLKQKDKIEDLLQELGKYTTESVGMLCFNRKLNSFDDTAEITAASLMSKLFELLQQSLVTPFKTFLYFKTKLYRDYEEVDSQFLKIVDRELTSQKEFLKKLKDEGKLDEYLDKEPNFMHSLLSDPRVTHEDACSLVFDLFGAGIDSTANSMVFLLVHIAMNPDKQQQLYQEIQRVVGDSNSLTKEHLAQMSYLKACVKESFRKVSPILLGTIRFLESDLAVGGYHLPKETLVAINMQTMCSDERFFPRPNEYLPERWLRDTTGDIGKGQEYPFALKPFGFGSRSCVGQRFAENEIFIGVTKIIQNFEISMSPGFKDVQATSKIFTSPAEKVVLHLKQRNASP